MRIFSILLAGMFWESVVHADLLRPLKGDTTHDRSETVCMLFLKVLVEAAFEHNEVAQAVDEIEQNSISLVSTAGLFLEVNRLLIHKHPHEVVLRTLVDSKFRYRPWLEKFAAEVLAKRVGPGQLDLTKWRSADIESVLIDMAGSDFHTFLSFAWDMPVSTKYSVSIKRLSRFMTRLLAADRRLHLVFFVDGDPESNLAHFASWLPE